MFFFVWTNDGGALQYMGLGLFIFQVSLVAFPSLTQALQQHTFVLGILGCLVGFAPVLNRLYRMIRRDGLSFGQIYHLIAHRLSIDMSSLVFAGLLVLSTVVAVHELMSGSSPLMGLCFLVAIRLRCDFPNRAGCH